MVYAALKSLEQNGQLRFDREHSEGRAEPGDGMTGGPMIASRYFVDLTQPEIAAQLKRNPLVILPQGSVEQHGPQSADRNGYFCVERDSPCGGGTDGRVGAARWSAGRDSLAHAV